MLVISRHEEESIVIGGEITVHVVAIRGDQVRLGIDAPKEIPVHRREIHDAIERDQMRRDQNDGREGEQP